ncbi:MAG: gluconate 2-dehydrogenase subunit 3 family protein [Acidobacteriia bacterium]|nr:gluconate 2-dehydrogenase subunit 3 family protein [Terriglobia bacterium]
MQPDERDVPQISRRTVIASAAIVPVAALTAAAQAPKTALSVSDRQILEAFVDRLAPSDELGPGALEMGAANYIDLCLADYLAAEKSNFVEGLAALDALARKEHDQPFVALSPERKDALLTAMDNGTASGFAPNSRVFFNRVRRLTLEGMFSDPYYGGNKNFAGWDLIRYPGPRLAVGPGDQKMSSLPKPLHQSAYGASHGH